MCTSLVTGEDESAIHTNTKSSSFTSPSNSFNVKSNRVTFALTEHVTRLLIAFTWSTEWNLMTQSKLLFVGFSSAPRAIDVHGRHFFHSQIKWQKINALFGEANFRFGSLQLTGHLSSLFYFYKPTFASEVNDHQVPYWSSGDAQFKHLSKLSINELQMQSETQWISRNSFFHLQRHH